MSKVIFKMTFKHPNLKDSVSKNIAHVNYIATRSGVDKTITESDLTKELNKGISEDEKYVKYIDERPRSHGLFGEDGIEDPNVIQKEISNVDSFVWRGIISIKEEDALDLGYLSKEKWQDFIRKMMPEIANEMGIKIDNLKWVAAVHMEKGHPHLHFMAWEKNPERALGVISTKSLDNIRKKLTDEVFYDRRFNLLNEKNMSRDMIRDLAIKDIGSLVREIKGEITSLHAFNKDFNKESIVPRLYRAEEKILIERITNLSSMMPGKGRTNLKFMPEDVKKEVREIADLILKKEDFTASLTKNINAVEELTKMYTGKEDAILNAKEKAYIDLKDRICQVILKGAVELHKNDFLHVDKVLANIAVDTIKNIRTDIDMSIENKKVLNELAGSLLKIGLSENEIEKRLLDYSNNENLKIDLKDIKSTVKEAKESISDANVLFNSKGIESLLVALKIVGFNENEAVEKIKACIHDNKVDIEKNLDNLVNRNHLKRIDNRYLLTATGCNSFLKIKSLDGFEKALLNKIEKEKEIDFDNMVEESAIIDNVRDYNQEFALNNYDYKLLQDFDEYNNQVSLDILKRDIFGKYNETQKDIDKAEKEFESLKLRLEKLFVNGYMKFDKESGIYSFTEEAKEEISKLPKEVEFTRYDASVTMEYFGNDESITLEQLKETIESEIVNQKALDLYDDINNLLDTKISLKYINLDDGNISLKDDFKYIGIEIGNLSKVLDNATTEESIKEYCGKNNVNFDKIMDSIDKYSTLGLIGQDKYNDSYILTDSAKSLSSLSYVLYKENGAININNLKEIIEKHTPNANAAKHYKYIGHRLDSLCKKGYFIKDEGSYTYTKKALDKKDELLNPNKQILRNKLVYLENIGLIKKNGDKYSLGKNYDAFKNFQKEKIPSVFNRSTADAIDKSLNELDLDKLERNSNRYLQGKYLNNDYDNYKTDYDNVRSSLKIENIEIKNMNTMLTALLVSGIEPGEAKALLGELYKNSNIDKEAFDEVFNKILNKYQENLTWGKETIISKDDWNQAFKEFGIDPPEWIYKGEGNGSLGAVSLINQLVKIAWSNLERQRMQTEAQAEMLKKQLTKQAARDNVAARKEEIRKSKDKGLYREEEFE